MTKHASELKMPQPVAWLCEFLREDGTTSSEVVMQDPEGTRWADMPDGDGVSPYKVTPLYAEPDILRLMAVARAAQELVSVLGPTGYFPSAGAPRTYALVEALKELTCPKTL